MNGLVEELDSALDALAADKKSDCGCGGKTAAAVDPGLAAELDAAIDALNSDLGFGDESADGDEFADLSTDSPMSLDDLVSMAERHPGLKITLSF